LLWYFQEEWVKLHTQQCGEPGNTNLDATGRGGVWERRGYQEEEEGGKLKK
jgi:hypothetical protein